MIHAEIKDGIVVCVRSDPYPPENPWTIEAPDAVECGWIYDGKNWTEPPELVKVRERKVWTNAAAFMAEFTLPELASVSLSQDPTVAALRLMLSAWPSDVWSDDPRIQMGLAALVSSGIIDETRKAELLAK